MEIWRDIPGYESLYQASDLGRVRSVDGKITRNAKYERRVWKQRIMKQKITQNKKGRSDARVCLWKDNKEKTWLVSRLVALTFVPGYSPEMTVNHIDGNPLNNCASNLEWVSRRENIQKGFETGLYPQTMVVVVSEGKIDIYRSLSLASKALGKNPGYLSCKINRYRKR